MSDPHPVARPRATAPAIVVRGRHGAVASPHHLATSAGLAILRAGGSAVDASIATNAALAVVSGYACGLGGDAFWLIWDPGTGRVLALNGSGRSARGATIEAARAAGLHEMPLRGPWTVTVPGAVASWGEAHARFGRLGWSTLLGPAIDLAEGFAASDAWIGAVEGMAAEVGTSGDWARIYRSRGRPWRPGEVVRLPALARTLRRLADEGPEAAYRGSLAGRTTAYLEAAGSPIRAVDLAAHTCEWGEPLAIPYRDVTCLSHPPNSVGVIALETLRVLEVLGAPEPSAFDGRGCADERWVHLGLEASRLALADRDAHVTDPERMTDGVVERLLSAGHARGLADRLRTGRALDPAPSTLPSGGGTIHLAAADESGQVVSMLQSNYRGFGSGLVDPETGISFQDRGAFFRLDPGHPNALAPGVRTFHTLTPGMILRDGRPWVAHGSMGGEIQPQVFVQMVSALVDGGLDIATAVAAPRWAALMDRHMGAPTTSAVEEGYHEGVAEALAGRGHRMSRVARWSSLMGHQNAVELVHPEGPPELATRASLTGPDSPTFAAASDPRAEGAAAAW